MITKKRWKFVAENRRSEIIDKLLFTNSVIEFYLFIAINTISLKKGQVEFDLKTLMFNRIVSLTLLPRIIN